MNFIFRFLLAILGACDIIFNIATPLVIALILISVVTSSYQVILIISGGILASLYRGIKIWLK